MKKRNSYLVKLLFSFFFLLLLVPGCFTSAGKKELGIIKDPEFPRWLISGNYSTDQTSGIIFIGSNVINENQKKIEVKNFLLADDVGKIHHFKIKNDTLFSFSHIYLSKETENYLSTFPKKDFEEITYDKYSNSVYLSIEGNNPDFKKYVGIYKLLFKNDNVFSDTISGIKKLDIKPEELFLKYTDNNIGYEGLAVDRDYFYLGLEGFQQDNFFADSTFLFVVNKKNLQIVKQINTKPLGIHTICGLFSDSTRSVYGVDRNNKQMFHFNLDSSLNISNFSLTAIPTSIPGFQSEDYVAAIESITMDNEGNVYMVDDPWKTFYVPPQTVLNKLDNTTVKNFKNFIPIIFKFQLK